MRHDDGRTRVHFADPRELEFRWETAEALAGSLDHDRFLADGWEPFAVTAHPGARDPFSGDPVNDAKVWFRRRVVGR